MSAPLDLRCVTRTFGSLTAVDRVSFEIGPGEIVGFIGPNGAGKTTTMRICSTLDLPSEGDVFVDGVSVLEDPRGARLQIGFMPDSFGAYPNTTVDDYLDFFASAYGLRGRERSRTLGYVKEFTALSELVEKEIRALSKGMKQRLCLAKTLLHDPKILILDEPASGLDPRARVELRELVKALADLGKAVLVSSHILSELGEMCHGVVVIELGRVRASGTLQEIMRKVSALTPVFARNQGAVEDLERALAELPHVETMRRHNGGIVFDLNGGDDEQADVLQALLRTGLRLIEFSSHHTGLEDAFLELTEGRVQ